MPRAGAVGLSLDGVRFADGPLSESPLGAAENLALMGRAEDVSAALRGLAASAGLILAPAPDAEPRMRADRWLARTAGTRAKADRARLRRRVDLGEETARTRIGELDAAQRARLRIAAALGAAASATTVTHIGLDQPFADVPGHHRAGLRTMLVRELAADGLGVVCGTDAPTDALHLRGRVIELDAEQVTGEGSLGEVLAAPRGGLSAALAGANVMSGLARGGWLSIGHSAVRRRTELDGKVYVAVPTDAATLSFDEFDPRFSSDAVFEAVVVGVRDEGPLVQVRLSPADTEVGLPLVVDLFDASARRTWEITGLDGGDSGGADLVSGAWAVLHPGLGDDLAAQLDRVRVGARLFVDVDVERIRAYPVEV